MSTSTSRGPSRPGLSGGALAGLTFAAFMLCIIGTFQIVAGLTAIIDDEFYVVTRNYTFEFDVTVWGWIHLLLGAAMLGTGIALFSRATWAVITAAVLASLSAIAQFFFIPYYPFWAILVIALDVWVLWSLTRPGAARD